MTAAAEPLPPRPPAPRRWLPVASAVIAVAIALMLLELLVVSPVGLGEGAVGSQARSFVSDRYAKLSIEVDWVADASHEYKPSASVIGWLQQRISAHVAKPGGVSISYGNVVHTNATSYTLADLRAAESANREAHTGGDTATIWILFANRYSESTAGGSVAGISYSGSALAVFAATIDDASSVPSFNDEVKEITALHEVGHLFGLVNLGTPMVTPHEDTAHRGHSDNESSVMYWAVEGSGLLGMIMQQRAPDDFDVNDVADLRGIGGK